MKTLILLPLLFISLFVYCQDIPKGSNVIKVTMTGPTDSVFNVVGVALLEQGYVIESKDEQFKTFNATLSPLEYTYKVKANIRLKDSVLLIKGVIINMGYEFPIEFTKYGGAPKRGFNDLLKFAQSLPGTITYEKIK